MEHGLDPESFQLHFGPYKSPRCRPGSTLVCEVRGREAVVGGMTDSPIQWPFVKKRGRRSLIICGDLVKAIAVESEVAVAHHWGVGRSTVSVWRRELGVGRNTVGSMKLFNHYIAKGRVKSRLPEARARMSVSQKLRVPDPQFREAALAAAKRPKSEAWKRKMSERMREQWAAGIRKSPFVKKQDRE
jgi:hypothetical protein